MKNQTITKENLKKIWDVACKDWKVKIEDYAKRNPFESKIELTGAEIDEMFAAADGKQKVVLNQFFEKEKDITDRVKTFENACNVLGLIIPQFGDNETPDEIAYKKLKIIIRALNEDWTPDWSNTDERKWYPYFTAASFGFDVTGYDNWNTLTSAGSRLCLKSRELAEYAGTQFPDIYKDFMIIGKLEV